MVSVLAFASSSLAQTQLVRGDVDSIQGTNQFRLDCTANVRLVSNTVNLQQLHDLSRQQDIEYEMQVLDVSSGGTTILNVVSAQQIPEILDMGNLRFGRSESWQVFAPSGSSVAVYIALTSSTSYLPLGGAGTWILPLSAPLLRSGVSTGGRFQFQLQMPTIPSLVGTSFSAQAIYANGSQVLITNPDCKEVRT